MSEDRGTNLGFTGASVGVELNSWSAGSIILGDVASGVEDVGDVGLVHSGSQARSLIAGHEAAGKTAETYESGKPSTKTVSFNSTRLS